MAFFTFAPLSPLLILCVGLAGACGALSRYLLGRFIAERASARFPFGTFIINVSGAFVIGVIFALVSHKQVGSVVQTILAAGFLGGYTTFSTMSWEGVQLIRGGSAPVSTIYLGGSMLLGLLAATLGVAVGGWL